MTLDEQRQAIRHELETLRANGARRQELSLHACKRLFFDLGIRPSMATVRDLTQTGSASDIPKDIDHFWERIREASKIRAGAGSIPKALEEKAGELLGELFEAARVHARAMLDEERHETQTFIQASEERTRRAEILREASEEARQRAETRADAAMEHIRELETELSAAATRRSANHENAQSAVQRLEAEKENLLKRLETEQAANATLRDRIDALHTELRQSTEHYAQQIKDAIAEAERRVKPMLVELDSLRSMAATYQSGIRDASRKEFDFIQQLSVAKARGDRLEVQVRSQSEELDALTREADGLRARGSVDPALATLLCSLAASGRLGENELSSIGNVLDGYVTIPPRCPKCEDGEPELSQAGTGYELLCPECEHSSGAGLSRFEAVARFLNDREAL
ncbi:DNA-binding protein [Trinickia terrae]|uniref:DNA-binding protein n=1 Tax=Trinickia terrae TaxID=2571161 RepID=A0A4U1I4Y2_9BURK|nr:DNA-binding protein [Trinickia terrae]TKC88358.1 DNA-binding protein [Trinickia terrae]